ncbi:hypothetical protein AVEN_208959-1 [Araneus ventricosus]|uniref:CRAL-TRIO domain-containing protein n=1 Tax=Araneus ventricosus TaxID=182803 RepID=A0A4Y2GEC7_ARAVE|nr:hypothetical protein AVEN_208959-1 [Araneus ventricosus]
MLDQDMCEHPIYLLLFIPASYVFPLKTGNKLSKDVEFEDDFLLAYLTFTKYDEKKAFARLRNYLNLRSNHSYFFRSVQFDLASHPSSRFATFLPHRLPDGSIIVLLEPGNWNPDDLSLETMKKIFCMMFLQQLRNPVSQASGFHLVHDFANTGVRYLKFCTPYNMYLLNHVTFDVLPGYFFGIHVLNTNFLMKILLNLSKPFVPEYFRNNIYIHSSPEKLQDFFPCSLLPTKYGGTLSDYAMPDFLRNANEQHDNFPVGGQKNLF